MAALQDGRRADAGARDSSTPDELPEAPTAGEATADRLLPPLQGILVAQFLHAGRVA